MGLLFLSSVKTEWTMFSKYEVDTTPLSEFSLLFIFLCLASFHSSNQ